MTPEQAADIRARDEALHAWMKANKRNSYKREELPAGINPPTNEERSACEVFEFQRDKPESYFAYVKRPANMLTKPGWQTCEQGELTTWTGDKLGTVRFGRVFRDSFGGVRVPITVQAITGETYHGTYYASAGDYARIRKAKHQTSKAA